VYEPTHASQQKFTSSEGYMSRQQKRANERKKSKTAFQKICLAAGEGVAKAVAFSPTFSTRIEINFFNGSEGEKGSRFQGVRVSKWL
jgi:hypothetical protein